ncbi:FixH family protein [Solirubrobacter sp. CPCC 204708]|uniref:FixH family protein n=1 Tax=Solirubrobacter deserti TaxID=2282478 RepID=A0ABT4RPS3_9ACTN|nr:FixH family protein [Solirubrobacter deserti]MBE2317534.1 FixH family protein [Solirubrobacter deserti]MDA0140290.1 FixH family protein [Solirubrobacter deserti]
MHRLLIAVALAASLVAAPSAFAGGWATVGLDSTPAGVEPGQPWNVNLTVLQHGRTPLEDVQPTLTIRQGGSEQTFAARATDKPGVYAVSVTFPRGGEWMYEVNDGFITGQPHTFPAVRIGDPASAPAASTTAADDSGPNWTYLGLGALAFLLAALILVGARLRHRHEPQAA